MVREWGSQVEREGLSLDGVTGAELEALLERAAAALEAGDAKQAVELAEAAVALDPSSKDAETVLAFARFRAREAAPERAVEVAARRRLTVLFCDIVGSTELAVSLDPEDTREVLLGYQRRAVAAIESFGGHLANFIGDGILAYFGHPQAHEDDALRAVLAARAVVDAMDAWRAGHPAAPQARVGVHTGLAVVAEMGVGARAITDDIVGETPNLAARLQGVAGPGEVVVSDATYRLVGAAVDVEPLGKVDLKGIGRVVGAFRIIAERDIGSRFDAMARPLIELVGREAELAALVAALDAGRDHRTTIVVEGEAGIGKSRLVRELLGVAGERGGRLVVLQCNERLANQPLTPVVLLLRRTLDLAALRREPDALAALAAATGLTDAAEAAAVASLLSLPHNSPPGVAEMAPGQRREVLFGAVLHLVDGMAGSGPLVVVVEDMHWADPTTGELVRRLASHEGVPLLLVLTTRPGGAPLPGAEVLRLTPLPDDASVELLQHVGEGAPLSSEAVAAIVERSDGIPLYVEELTRVLVDPASGWSEDASGIPATLSDLLVARLDQFAKQRSVVTALATIGQPATLALLAAVLEEPPDTVASALDELVAGALVRRTGEHYEFRHILVRDAAYHLQLHRRRRTLHRQIADVIAGYQLTVGEDHPGVLALHYEQADEPVLAASAYFSAGLRQADLAAHEEAIASFRKASRLAEPVSAELPPGFEVDVEHALATSLLAVRGYTAPEVAEAFERVRVLTSTGQDRHQLAAVYGLWAFHHVRGDNRTSAELADQLTRLAEPHGEPSHLAAKAVLGYQRVWHGDLTLGLALLEEASLRPAELGADPLAHDPGSGAAANRAVALALLGDVDAARQAAAAATERAGALTSPTAAFTFSYVTAWAAMASNLCEAHDEAQGYAGACIEKASQYGFSTWLAVAWIQLLIAQASTAPNEEVVGQLVGALQMYDAAGARSNRSQVLHTIAAAQQQLGQLAAAVAALDDALEHVEAADERFMEAELHRAHAMAITERDGVSEAAIGELQGAADLARAQSARLFELRALRDLVAVAEGAIAEQAAVRLAELLAWFGSAEQPSVAAARQVREAL